MTDYATGTANGAPLNTQENLYISGGTGYVGRQLVRRWNAQGPEYGCIIQTRDPHHPQLQPDSQTHYVGKLADLDTGFQPAAIVNLAGAGIAEKRWSEDRKRVLLESRVNLTEALIADCKRNGIIPPHVVSASAVGYYGATAGSTDDPALDESAPSGDGFAADLCRQWEQTAMGFNELGEIPVCLLRLGVVLGPESGFIKKLKPIYQLGAGGPIGSGRQGFSWIHIDDLVSLIMHVIKRRCEGVFNATAPNPVPQKTFAKTFAKVLKRPVILPTPPFALKLLYGEMADELLLRGQNVIPSRAMKAGITFEYPELQQALEKT